MRHAILTAVVILLAALTPASALEPLGSRGLAIVNGGGGEFFLTPVPIDWTIAHAKRGRRAFHLAWVPDGQTAADWEDKVSVQMFPGATDVDAKGLLDGLAERYDADCGTVLATAPEVRKVRGREIGFRFIGCTRKSEDGLGEVALFRTVAGAQSFYLVQRAWRTPAFKKTELPFSREILGKTRLWLQGGRVCDAKATRPERACPPRLAQPMSRTSLDRPFTIVRLAQPGSGGEE